ncbi:MAG: adenylate/guanylate cyclase domain-containing protein, partial [Rhodospirillaceae bacterium]|nr:adenylate/guanylate cyclase domain-containing protein [Rhodospirillaceae bacterium]
MDSTDAGSYTAAMPEGTQRRLTTIVAADIAGFSRLIGIDEEGTLAAQRGHRTELIEPLLAEYHGRIANTAGDSFLFEFASAVEAVRCAVAVQEGMVTRNGDIPDESRIEYRIGINVGDVIADGDDLLGDGVNIAARLEGLADPGCIYMSHTARDQIRDRLEIELEDP